LIFLAEIVYTVLILRTEIFYTILIFRTEIVLTILLFYTEIVLTVSISRTEIVLTILIFLTEISLTVLVFLTEIVLTVSYCSEASSAGDGEDDVLVLPMDKLELGVDDDNDGLMRMPSARTAARTIQKQVSTPF
jgi:hypothetical protein